MRLYICIILSAILLFGIGAICHDGNSGCPNVYVDGKRIGTILQGCVLNEGRTFLPLPEGGATIEVKMEDYEIVYIKNLAIVELDRAGKVKVGGLLSHKWDLEIREWCVGRYTETYVKFKKGDRLEFREPIKENYFLMATGWTEPSK